MAEDRDKLSENDEIELEDNDVEAHSWGETDRKVLGEDSDREVLSEDGERSRLE